MVGATQNTMPEELRRIVFNYAEISEAITHYGAQYKLNFPVGKVVRAKMGSNMEYEINSLKDHPSPFHQDYNVTNRKFAVILTFFDEKTFENKYINVTADFIASALIDYCIRHQIMIPKSGQKMLEITDFNICLEIKFHAGTEHSGPILSLED